MGMCQYSLCVDSDNNSVNVCSPEGLLIETVTGSTLDEALRAAVDVVNSDVGTFGCDASWSCNCS